MTTKINRFFCSIIILVLLAFVAGKSFARDIPVRLIPLNDEVGLLDNQIVSDVSDICQQAYKDFKSEIAVLIIRSTDGINANDYALRVFNKWGLGQAGINNGMLILFAIEDRRVEIMPGSRYKSVFNSAFCNSLLTRNVIPEMRAGKLAQGVLVAVREIANEIKIIEEKAVKFGSPVSGDDHQGVAKNNNGHETTTPKSSISSVTNRSDNNTFNAPKYELVKTTQLSQLSQRGLMPKYNGGISKWADLWDIIWNDAPGYISDSELISILDSHRKSFTDTSGSWEYFEGKVVSVSPSGRIECSMHRVDRIDCKFYFNIDNKLPVSIYENSFVHILGQISNFSESPYEYTLENSILLNAPFIAIEKGDSELLTYLLGSLKYNPNSILNVRMPVTVLQWAIKNNNLAMVKLLVQHGAIVDTYFDTEGSPLDYAIRFAENFDIINFLLSLGAKASVGKNFSSLTVCCCRKDEFAADIAKMLIENGCDVNLKPENGNYPIVLAADGNIKLLKVLLENGANPNVDGAPSGPWSYHKGTALVHASSLVADFQQGVDKVRLLIQFGADVNQPYTFDNSLDTPLGAAIMSNNPKVIKILVEKGADLNQKFDDLFFRSGLVTPLRCAEKYNRSEIATFLKNNGAR